MPKRSRIKKVFALLLCWLLLLPSLHFGGMAQTLQERRRNDEGQKHRKLAPHLEETLAQAEKDEAEFNHNKTLGQLRREKLQNQPSLAGVWSQPLQTFSAQTVERVIVNLSGLATDITLKSCLLKLGGRVHQVHPNLGVAAVELPLGRVRELAAEAGIEYVSPDRPIQAFGHLEATTGADQARTLAILKGVPNLDGTVVAIQLHCV